MTSRSESKLTDTRSFMPPLPCHSAHPAHSPPATPRFSAGLRFLVSHESLCLFPCGFLYLPRSVYCQLLTPAWLFLLIPLTSASNVHVCRLCLDSPAGVGFLYSTKNLVLTLLGLAFRVCCSEIVCTSIFLFFSSLCT